MKKKTAIYIGFFALLLAGFYIGLKATIPGFGEVKMPVLNYVQPFSFTNQNNEVITQKDVAGKVYIAEYFFTTCRGICPKMNTNMKALYNKFKNEKGFLILSHTVDPQTDTVGRMKRYADSIGAPAGGNWYFLTGTKDSLYKAARVSYLLDDPKNGNDKIENQFIHTQFFALVDKSGRVRKIYDGLKRDELTELENDIPKLLNEKEGGSFVNSLFSN
ncbi:MAG TPA: SCO family protein [Chitinophagaceae bacterium]|jgi:protein SCO1|nr:SCO family protein [Chitinophagaceae bacterium]